MKLYRVVFLHHGDVTVMSSEFRLSRHLLFIAFGLILLGIVNAAIVSHEIQTLQYGARVINSLGIIRGSVQRAVKLQLAHDRPDSVIRTVDSLIEDFSSRRGSLLVPAGKTGIASRCTPFRERWTNLKSLLDAYRARPDSALVREIVSESEAIWGMANDLVLAAQMETESRIRYLEIVVVIIGLNIAAILWIMWLNKTFIRNRLEVLASHDALTGAFNRHSFASIIEREFQGAKRYGHPLSILMLDIDHFKQVNDTYGHRKGDEVLAYIAKTISAAIRRSDSLCRIGGEEFAVIAPMTGIEKASTLAEKLRLSVDSNTLGDIPSVTVSIGVSHLIPGDDREMFILRADDALYTAKRSGRNRVIALPDIVPADSSPT